MIITVTKLEAARRHLDTAIALHFAGGDSVSVHTLATAAFTVTADLAELKTPGESWRSKMEEDNYLSTVALLRLLRNAQNFFKHADQDPDGVLEFEETENDHVLFVCTQQYVDLAPPPLTMQAYDIWFFAVHADRWKGLEHPAPLAIEHFRGIAGRPRSEQLAIGAAFLAEAPAVMQGTV